MIILSKAKRIYKSRFYFFLIFLTFITFLTFFTLPCQAQEPPRISTISVTMEPILGGVVVRFYPSDEIKRRIDHFLVYRSGVEKGRVVASTDTAARLNYYHDWYKDYFYENERGKTFAYRVEAYDLRGGKIGASEPEWNYWKARRLQRAGIMMTPSAYRQIPFYGSTDSGSSALFPINVDVTASYYIGRLYSYNRYDELTKTRRSLFSRIGVMFWQVDTKVILEREGRYFPQLALGAEGSMMLNNAPAPDVSAAPGITLTTKEKNRTFNGLFLVVSKDLGWINPTIGYMRGESPSKLIYLAEYLTKESEAKAGLFAGMVLRLGRKLSLHSEFIRPVGAKASPFLVNLQVGRALHTNFDVAYMKYDRAYEILAHINFRYTMYPTYGKK